MSMSIASTLRASAAVSRSFSSLCRPAIVNAPSWRATGTSLANTQQLLGRLLPRTFPLLLLFFSRRPPHCLISLFVACGTERRGMATDLSGYKSQVAAVLGAQW
jgi:hypothetical protein